MLNGVGAPSVRIKFDLIAYACVNAIVWETLSTAPSKPDSKAHQTKPNEMNAYTLSLVPLLLLLQQSKKKSHSPYALWELIYLQNGKLN